MTALEPPPKPPAADEPGPGPVVGDDAGQDLAYRRLLLIIVMLAVMAFGSLMTIVTVSLDQIAADVDSDRATLTWMITGVMLSMAITTPIAGKLGDVHGHRRMFLIGLVGGVLTTLAAALAWDATSLIATRVAFGITGAFVTPNGMALMMHAYGRRRRATAMGWFQFAMTGAPTIGLVLGGPLIDIIGWRWLFAVFSVVSAVAAVVGARLIRPTPRQERVSIDYLGAATLAAAVLAGLLALTQASASARTESPIAIATDPVMLGLLALSGVATAAFIGVERRAPAPMLHLRYFRRRNFTLPMVASAAMQFAYMGGFVVAPALLATRYGLTESVIALLLVPRPGSFSLSSPAGGYLASLIGERRPMIFGATAMVASMTAFAVAANLSGATGLVVIVLGLVLSGTAAGIAQPAVASLVVGAVDQRDMGVATGMTQQLTFIGIVTGIQTMNVFIGDDAGAGQFTTTFLFGAVVAAFGVAAALGCRSTPSVSTEAAAGDAGTARR